MVSRETGETGGNGENGDSADEDKDCENAKRKIIFASSFRISALF